MSTTTPQQPALGSDIISYLISTHTKELISRDLAHVCSASKSLHSFGKKALYRDVSLRSGGANVRETIALLGAESSVASSVRKLQLTTEGEGGWVPFTIFRGMKHLKHLCLVQHPFVHEMDQANFVTAITTSCPELEEFEYVDRVKPFQPFHNDYLGISGLKRINFDSCMWFLGSPGRGLTLNNHDTITHLSFPATMDDRGILEQSCAHLFEVNFPNLRSVSLGVVVDPDEEDYFFSMTHFLIRYGDKIEEISIGFCTDDEWATNLVENSYEQTHVPREKLHSALKTLHASVPSVNILLRQAPHIFKTLEKLSTGDGLRADAAEDAGVMFKALHELSLDALEEFIYAPGESTSSRIDSLWIDGIKEKAPRANIVVQK